MHPMKKIPKSKIKLDNIKTAGIILKPASPDLREFYLEAKAIFERHGIKTIVEKNSAKFIGVDGYNFETVCKNSDFLVSIGGDGTLISVARRSVEFHKPVLGVNLGTLGFLTNIKPEELEDFIKKMLIGDYRIDRRMMIETNIAKKTIVAFNDIVITKKAVPHMITVEAKIDGKLFNRYYGDGIIISTPTGSSAYNLSCGGPIVYPLTEAFIVTPISPHSLTQRPLVLPADYEIEICTPDLQGANVIIDGQDIYELAQNKSLFVQIASNEARLINTSERNYFEVLREKMGWGNK